MRSPLSNCEPIKKYLDPELLMVVNGIGTRTTLVQTANAIVTDLSYWCLFVYLDVLLRSTCALILVPAVW